MKGLLWVVMIASLAGLAWGVARWRRQWNARQQAADARMASFIAQASPSAATVAPTAAAAAPPPAAPQERLLLDAAAKAAEAGEPAIAIRLYARLLARYPQTQFAAQARSAVEAQKKLAQA